MRRRIGKPDLGLTGSMAESEALDKTTDAIEFEKWKKWREENHYIAYRESMDHVRNVQPGNPDNPKARFANNLRTMIAKALSPEDYEKIKFFTAVGSNLDYQHGVDAFFDIEIIEGETHTITMDVKTYEPKRVKADVLIVYPEEGLDPEKDEEEWNDLLVQSANSIISSFGSKIGLAAA
jgi:hypothetical protein